MFEKLKVYLGITAKKEEGLNQYYSANLLAKSLNPIKIQSTCFKNLNCKIDILRNKHIKSVMFEETGKILPSRDKWLEFLKKYILWRSYIFDGGYT